MAQGFDTSDPDHVEQICVSGAGRYIIGMISYSDVFWNSMDGSEDRWFGGKMIKMPWKHSLSRAVSPAWLGRHVF